MLHILFVILKVIGILLLAILGIILFLVFSSLLIPFSYQIKGEKTEETWNARIRLSWLFYAVYLVKEFGGENSRFECYLLGIPMLRLNTWLNHKRAGKRTKTGTKNKETFEMDSVKSVEPKADSETAKAKTLQNTEGSEKKRDSEEKNSTERALNSKTADDKNFKNKNIVDTENVSEDIPNKKSFFKKNKKEGFLKRVARKIKAFLQIPKKIRFIIRKIYDKIKNILSFLRSEDFRWMKKVGLTEGKALFQHIRPRKIKGNIRFGFENPANTGEVLGILGIIYPVLPRKLTIIPDFNQSVLEGSLEARGRVYGIFFLIRTLKVLFDGKTITIIKKLKHKET